MPWFLRLACRIGFFSLSLFPGIAAAQVFTVVNTNSSGPGSLAQAVDEANMNGGTVAFNIPGPGVHKIYLGENGVALGFSVTVDGYTQPGASPNTLSVGDNAIILIQLDGGGPFGAHSGGIGIYGNNCVVRGLSLTGFSGLDQNLPAILIGSYIPEYGAYNRIEGCFIGLAPDGVTLRGNDYGIYFFGGMGQNVFGGDTPAARNLISGNRTGIYTLFCSIIGNYFGTDASGLLQGYGNDRAIASISDTIGTGEPGAGNVFAGNGISISATEGIVRGNMIGLLPDGSPAFGNGTGIQASFTMIGGLEPGQGNIIAFQRVGVEGGGSILSNQFYGNSFMDIDVWGDGPTPNDFHDLDVQRQNFPIIASVVRNPGETIVSGSLNSRPATNYTLQFSANGPPSALGQRLLGTENLATDVAGDASFQFTFPIETSEDEFITATATNPDGETSEFFPADGAVEFGNISTRGYIGTGDDVMIAGYIVNSGNGRGFLVRALGPSLNISGALADPQIFLTASGGRFALNDNWRNGYEQQVLATGLAPTDDREAALIFYPGHESVTVRVSGVNGGTGIGTVEVYALGQNVYGYAREALNISTRGKVGTGDEVLVGGTIIVGSAVQRVIVRAIGPDLANAGVAGPLQDPTLELRDAVGTLLASNDDWRSDQEQEIIATGLAPLDDRDAAVVSTLSPTSCTAIVRGKGGTTGIALVELYKLE